MASFAPSFDLSRSPLADLVRGASQLVIAREGQLHLPPPACHHCGATKVVHGRCYYCETPTSPLVRRLPIPAEGTPVLK